RATASRGFRLSTSNPVRWSTAIAAEARAAVNQRSVGWANNCAGNRSAERLKAAVPASLARRGPLRSGVDGIERLARRHKQAIALRPAKADIAADLRNPNAAEQLAVRVPHRNAAVADRAPGIARAPQVAVDIGAHAVGTALYAVDHEVAEQFAVGELVVA